MSSEGLQTQSSGEISVSKRTKTKNKQRWVDRFQVLFLSVLAILILLPIFYMISMSFRTRREIMMDPLGLPSSLLIENYQKVAEAMNYGTSIFNTIFITASVIVLVSILSSLAAYPLARIRHKLSTWLYILLTLGLVIPPFAGLTPLYLFMRDLGLLNSYLGLIIAYTTLNLPLGVFFYTSFMKSVPIELEEAARLDGASYLKTYWYVVLPLLRPITGTLGLFITLTVWNDIVYPLLFVTDDSKYTIMVAVVRFLGTYSIDPTQLFPAAVLASAPLLILFMLLQKQVVSGITAGAVK
ncbi:carbohydrate ABC transporter permease [Alginatibacterium sediminis]|uniref:Carbohydrate ABC transporter permease n=1 Tax=Alginatibacterium sediminis TaxID=2164068 RepID=A0A420EGG6_9ALTE|nr:carbohydrate ABC transporter permease [Alginatibacterium sediminis]RKF19767.1 carbohydrate ABC transporter permease [Alginatibacterium sediminis]